MSSLTNEELTEATRKIEKRMDQLAVPYEDALSHRTFLKVYETLKKYLLLWGSVFSVAIGLFGYIGYQEIIKSAKQKIEEQITKQVSLLQNSQPTSVALHHWP